MLTSNQLNFKHGILYATSSSDVSSRPFDRECRSLEELLVRVLLVDAKLFKPGLCNLANQEGMAGLQMLFSEPRVVDERLVLHKNGNMFVVSHVHVRQWRSRKRPPTRQGRVRFMKGNGRRGDERWHNPLTHSPPSIFCAVYIPMAATMLGLTRRK